VDFTRKIVQEAMDNEHKEFLEMPDVNNYKALFNPGNHTYGISIPNAHEKKPSWYVFNENNKPIVVVYEDGHIDYRKIGKFFNSGWNTASDAINFGFDEDAVRQAARWYFVTIAQQPKPVTESTSKKAPFVFDDIDGYQASGPYEDSEFGDLRDYKYWSITDREGKEIGILKYGGEPEYDGALEYASNKYDEFHQPIWINVPNQKFTTNPDGIKQAARYIYLMRQISKKPISESNNKDFIKFPKIGNFSAKRKIQGNTNGWEIFNANDKEIGFLEIDGTVWYVSSETGSYRLMDEKISNIKNAVEHLYLKSQEPVGKKRHTLKAGDKMNFPDIKGWYAVVYRAGHINISDSDGRTQGFLSHDGEVWLSPPNQANVYSGMTLPFTKKGLKTAVQYVYLSMFKPKPKT
jgi:hypothetical protein